MLWPTARGQITLEAVPITNCSCCAQDESHLVQEQLVRCTAPAEVMYSLQQEQLSFPTANTTTGAVGKVHRSCWSPTHIYHFSSSGYSIPEEELHCWKLIAAKN